MVNKHVLAWVKEMEGLCKPDRVVWCDGSKEEKERLTKEAFKTGELIEFNQEKLPGCVFHRTAENDVARTEHLTFICTSKKEDAGPTNNWMAPVDAYSKLSGIFDGAMRGRTMYVVPFIMGAPGSHFNKIGVEITDSIYVVLNMRIMTNMGDVAMKALGNTGDFTKCLHSKADLDINRRFICHFPEDNTIWSVGSGYGGNVLLGKKCLALRIASYMGRKEGWMAEHMTLMGIEKPDGEIIYVAGAFPSACGKTNLAMLIPPESMKGYKIWTLGDDIVWLRIGKDGRMWAINPETGFFGVAPGTNKKTNGNAMRTISKNTIFTNVLLKEDRTVWWEGLEDKPEKGIDWKGDQWNSYSGKPGAHPNSRFTTPISQCPTGSPETNNPEGVPISAVLFGGRRAKLAPLVYESFNWQHGVFVAATMASEPTAAISDEVHEIRRDPMAMLPFIGYNAGDYFKHWLDMGKKLKNPPKIFHVNWFRTDGEGKFMWPGFGENLRVLEWIIHRADGGDRAVKTPIGYVPARGVLNLDGVNVSAGDMEKLLSVDPKAWIAEAESIKGFFDKIGGKLPKELEDERKALVGRLKE
ncbi:MAG: phosphoenolpyruvate carboxykinase [Candidatus Altiarchaeales archaeon IMC4]|nr:MAG: phosphoenolpyruvate carboxykinase [Candidatus Altiarchaeales archaeon IMC4]